MTVTDHRPFVKPRPTLIWSSPTVKGLEVEFVYDKGEPPSQDRLDPGCAGEVEIVRVWLHEMDITSSLPFFTRFGFDEAELNEEILRDYEQNQD